MIRSFSYWMCATALAFFAVQAVGSEKAVEDGLNFEVPGDALLQVMPVPEPARAAFLGIGIISVAFTYRRAWLNRKRRDEARA